MLRSTDDSTDHAMHNHLRHSNVAGKSSSDGNLHGEIMKLNGGSIAMFDFRRVMVTRCRFTGQRLKRVDVEDDPPKLNSII